ncbi:MAG: response regulator transcription factor [Lachnospiraceae bacterium]|jgi:DNA-binding response OmpR family regulator|nr:response regulator transcription factor [Lachnospiraceae bacterium]MBP5415024.1 response regulator transcription factor [Lachnospiraceae bacterium]MBP5746270.1 response regulator transcription factor [Lachnospiraceae bacterium]MBR6147343.1 response regulator transcription factor [Lachnospiraceae bacterium]
MSYRILIAEDDNDIVEILRLYLENEGFELVISRDGEEALNNFESTSVDMALIDIMMPKLNGYELIKKMRDVSNIPIIVMSAKNMDSDKILGLTLGADDYLTKPFNPLEVVARIKSQLRRFYDLNTNVQEESNNVITVGELVMDPSNLSVNKNGQEINLTPTEFKILALMMKTPGKIYTKMQIFENINGDYYESDDNTLMVHISKIRDKIEDDPKSPKYLKTVRGLGYKIEKH